MTDRLVQGPGGQSGRGVAAPARSSRRPLSSRRRFVIILLTLGGTLALGLALLEVGMRLVMDVTDLPYFAWEPCIGWRIAPNQDGRWLYGSYMDGRFHFNAQGWNHPDDYVVAKPPGVRRICLVGDSMVESLQVQPRETMFAVAEGAMKRAGTPAQWYAFGVSGYGTAQEYEVIRRFALEYHPDVVILLFVQNDPSDTSPYIADLEPYVVRYILDESDALSMIFPSEWRPSQARRLVRRSALVRYFMIQKQLLDRFRNDKMAAAAARQPFPVPASEFRNPVVPGLATMSSIERQEKTWLLIAKLLEATRDECRRRGATFAVAFRGWWDEIDAPIHPEPEGRPPREADPYCLNTRMREMGREQLAPIVKRLGIPYLDLTDALHSAVARTGRSHRFPDDKHFSPAGHSAAGEALAAWVESLSR